MSKIIKKNDITKLVESTMIEAGLLKEGENVDYTMGKSDDENQLPNPPDEIHLDVNENEDECEVDVDVVEESVNRLAKDVSKHNIITENVKNDLERFNKIMNYKYH
jgi:hypothetical protein